MGRHPEIPGLLKQMYPKLLPDDALYALYTSNKCNCSKVARIITEDTGTSVSPSGIWRHIERIDKDKMINGFNGVVSNGNI